MRNESAFADPLPEILSENNIGFCIHDYRGIESPLIITSDMIYIRFHGYGRQYAGSYPDNVLTDWSRKMKKWSDEGRTICVYFNNDLEGSAISNALTLREYVSGY
jgi:uncharacterized protein YecE (DUF72 family)